MGKYIDCNDCQNHYDCERTYLGGCTDGKKWEEKKLTDEQLIHNLEEFAKDIDMNETGIYTDILDLIHRLLNEVSQWKSKAEHIEEVYNADREHFIKTTTEQKAEIERLTEERNKYKELYETMYRKYSDLQDKEFNCEALRKEKNEYFDKAVELQKRVDELKEELEKAYITERANIQAEIADCGVPCHWCRDLTVKDTAKENAPFEEFKGG